jgi:hypothetical protein
MVLSKSGGENAKSRLFDYMDQNASYAVTRRISRRWNFTTLILQ